MKGIVADNDIRKHWALLLGRIQSEQWREFWISLNLTVETFETLGLPENVADATLWHRCQERQIILITNNRNQDRPDSLEATIRIHNKSSDLPVLTLANARRFLHDKEYAERVAEQLLRYLLDIEGLRGTGRLYLP
jgi:hypothetical protein